MGQPLTLMPLPFSLSAGGLRAGAMLPLVILALSGWAQGMAALRGVVVDPGGAPVAGASVVAVNRATGATATAVSDAEGGFALAGLADGAYELTISRAGFSSLQMEADGGDRALRLTLEPEPGATAAPPRWNLHVQSTAVAQGHAGFAAAYSGANSLSPVAEARETVSFDVTNGVRLWPGGEFYSDLLVWQGYGLSNTLGAAGFPNGEAFRLGETFPDAAIARAYLRQTVALGAEREAVDDAPDALPGSRPARRLTLTLGRLSAKDLFDNNAYANDPRTQFLNWDFMANLAWDYPANTIGFTTGAAAEYTGGNWSARAGVFQVSRVANGLRLDWDLAHAHSAVAELERRFHPGGRAGALRLLAYHTEAPMGSYQATLNTPADHENIGLTAANRDKYGFGLNGDQQFRGGLGGFFRLGWSDGKNQTYEFTDVDRTASAGLSIDGSGWGRGGDTVGVAAAVNGLSAVHRQYLAAGGLGITVGDGGLDYRTERVEEAFYNWRLNRHYQLTLDSQYLQNPGYNHVRGPVPLAAVRLHVEY